MGWLYKILEKLLPRYLKFEPIIKLLVQAGFYAVMIAMILTIKPQIVNVCYVNYTVNFSVFEHFQNLTNYVCYDANNISILLNASNFTGKNLTTPYLIPIR